MEANQVNAIAEPSIMGILIAQLRANAPIFGGRVAGAAEYYAGLRNYNTSMALPAAYVLPLGQEAEPNNILGGGLVQLVHKSLGIVVEFDAQTDRRGQSPTMNFEEIEAQLFASVLNLFIPNCRMSKGIAFEGARFLDLDRARLFYRWEFAADMLITDDDGVQPASVPLTQVEVDVFHAPGAVGVPGSAPAAVVVVPTGDPPHPPPTDGPWPKPATED
jgi:hypothetical protein